MPKQPQLLPDLEKILLEMFQENARRDLLEHHYLCRGVYRRIVTYFYTNRKVPKWVIEKEIRQTLDRMIQSGQLRELTMQYHDAGHCFTAYYLTVDRNLVFDLANIDE
jgi:hypothetical protein